MAHPNPYARQQNFTNWQSSNPGVIYNGTDLDNEFNAIMTALNATIADLGLIQRADGAIANQSVGRDQLAASVVQGINTPAMWVTGHTYSQRDSVIQGNAWYWCEIAHTSGTFATDLAAGNWVLISDFSLLIGSAGGAFSGTSVTSLAIGAGSATFATQANKDFLPGQFVTASSAANVANFMHGQVTSYSGTSLVVNVLDVGGTGTHSDWNLSIAGPQGTTGAQGPVGTATVPWCVAAGSADAITGTYSPSNMGPADGLVLSFRAGAANATTTPTFNPDGLGARTITKQGGVALAAGDIPGALAECLVRYNLANTRWELLNPKVVLPPVTSVAGRTGAVTLGAADISGTAWTQASLTNNNQLANGENFAVRGDNVSEFVNNAGYLTAVPSTYGAVGTYTLIFLSNNSVTISAGTTYTSGSPACGALPAGNWLAMGNFSFTIEGSTTSLALFLRTS